MARESALREPHAGTIAVSGDEDHSGGFKRGADSGEVVSDWLTLTAFEISDSCTRDSSVLSEIGLRPSYQSPRSPTLCVRDQIALPQSKCLTL
jgi:hypothetical protein